VPIRMSETICVEDRLPLGTAAVLINQTHAYKDLLLLINSREKRLFDGIDGVRSIGNIAEMTMSSSNLKTHHDIARVFFERLWWHDQVVFDASHRTQFPLASRPGQPVD
jgi:hypothetical protein